MHFEEQIRAHALAETPREACGFIRWDQNGDVEAQPTANTHPEPETHFRIHPEAYLEERTSGRLIGYYHSHPIGSHEASEADQEVCEDIGLPVFIYGVATGVLGVHVPTTFPVQPLEGRRFVPMVSDCVALVWDYYKRVLEIDLPFFPRTQTDYRRGTPINLREFLEGQKVRAVATPEMHDILVMNLYGADRPSHLAVYIGDGLILHQLGVVPSRVEPWGGQWRRACSFIFRHEDAAGKGGWAR